MRLIFLCSLFFLNSAFAAAARKPSSELLIERLQREKWKCENKSSAKVVRAIECIGHIQNYSQKIRIYIPQDFGSESSWKLSLYFHGHRLAQYETFQSSDDAEKAWGDYARFLADSKTNGILIAPESQVNCKNFETEIAAGKKFLAFLNTIEKIIGSSPNSYSIAAHSGAYRTVNSIMKLGLLEKSSGLFQKLESVGLFDAVYSDLPQLREFYQNHNIKLALYWISGIKGTTVLQTENFIQKLKSVGGTAPGRTLLLKPYGGDESKSGTYNHMNLVKEGGLPHFLAL